MIFLSNRCPQPPQAPIVVLLPYLTLYVKHVFWGRKRQRPEKPTGRPGLDNFLFGPALSLPAHQADGPVGAVLQSSLGHLATAFEYHALVDDEDRGEDVAVKPGRGMAFDPVPGPDVAVHLSADDQAVHLDFRFEEGGFADDQRSAGPDFTGKASVQPDDPLEGEQPFDADVGADESADVPARPQAFEA